MPETPEPHQRSEIPNAPKKSHVVRSYQLDPAVCRKLFPTGPPDAPRKAPVPSIRGRIGPPIPQLDLNN